jgi:hypothetical protein
MIAMHRIATLNLARALRRVTAVLVLGGGALLFAAPARADWHGGGHWHGGWGWGPRIGLYWGGPAFYGYPYYAPPYGYYPAPAPAYYPPPAPASVQIAPGPAPAQSWYYCDNPRGYYPNIQSCAAGWRAVPVTPPGAPPSR